MIYGHLPWDQLTNSFEEVMAPATRQRDHRLCWERRRMLWVKSRVDDDRSAKLPAELFGAPELPPKAAHDAGQRSCALHAQLGEPGPWFESAPALPARVHPEQRREIQSE